VPAPSEDDRKIPDDHIDPELNPMTNTLLAQHMGRWAEVYFTTPAEKREEAVRELLRELKSGVTSSQKDDVEEKVLTSEREISQAKEKFVELEKQFAELTRKRSESRERASGTAQPAADEILCPACLSKNKSGQRFCGLCGFTLTTSPATPAPVQENPKPQPAELPLAAPERDGSDWGWLHERNRTVLAEKHADRGTWKYSALVAVLLIACGAGYLWWRGDLQTSSADEKSQSGMRQGQTPEPHAAAPSGTAKSETSSERTPSPGEAVASTPSSGRMDDSKKAESAPAATETASGPKAENATPSGATETPAPPIAGGQQELETARRYLDGRGVPKDPAIAAQWLWKSVAKKNPEAIVMLSRLYATGDGVPRNCDQARLLLTSAAQKGSEDAKGELERLVSTCP
jgi:cytoskeletal protein RodZ